MSRPEDLRPTFQIGDRVKSVTGAACGLTGTVIATQVGNSVRVQFDGRILTTGKLIENLRHVYPEHVRMDEGL